MWSTRAISAEEISSPTTIIAAPMRFATERSMCSHVFEPGRDDAHLERACLELVRDLRRSGEGRRGDCAELSEEVAEELVRLHARLGLGDHQLERLLFDQRDRVELRVERARDRVRLGEGLADESEARGQADAVGQADALEVRERLSGADPGEWAPVVARQLPPQLVDEARLVRLEGRQREREQQGRHVLGAVVREREQQQGEGRPRLLVEAAQEPEVEQGQAAVLSQEHVPAMRVGVVNAGEGDLPDVGAEEVAGKALGPFMRKPVPRDDLLAVDPLQDEHALGHVRPDHLRHDQILEVLEETGDQLGVARLLDEVELCAQVGVELVGQCSELEQLRGLGVLFEQTNRRADHVEVELDLLDDPGAANLDDYVPSVLEQRLVDLRDRGCGQRLGLEPGDASAPRSSRTIRSTSENGKGGTSSTSLPSSSM